MNRVEKNGALHSKSRRLGRYIVKLVIFSLFSTRFFYRLVHWRPAIPGRDDGGRVPILLINLKHRPDRLEAAIHELYRAGFEDVQMFDAIAHSNGPLGCGLSHTEALRMAPYEHQVFAIAEDDIVFHVDSGEIKRLIGAFKQDPFLDVLCLANNQQSPPIRYSKLFNLTFDTQTTAFYVVKPRAVPGLVDAFSESVRLLTAGEPPEIAAIDKVWKKAQLRKLAFAVPRGRVATQRPGWSDIQGAFVSYGV